MKHKPKSSQMSMTQIGATLGTVYGGPAGFLIGAIAGAVVDANKPRAEYEPKWVVRKKTVYYYQRR
jgi:membrane protein YqaA with SNARE-associated domain